jgi:hypothetical protein
MINNNNNIHTVEPRNRESVRSRKKNCGIENILLYNTNTLFDIFIYLLVPCIINLFMYYNF